MKKIALIEDNYYFLDNLIRLLITKDYKIKAFKSIKEAEDGLELFNPDLILTDITLPDGNVENLIERLRENRFFNYVPIIILTGTPDIEPDSLLAKGVYKILFKPIEFKILNIYILGAIKKREQYLIPENLLNKAKKLLKPIFFKQ